MKKNTLLALCLFCFLLIGCNNKATENSTNNNQEVSNTITVDYKSFDGFDYPTDDLKLKIDGVDINFTLPVYLEKNRYYISLNELVDKLSGTISRDANILKVSVLYKSFDIDLSTNNVSNSSIMFLKKPLIQEGEFFYIGFSDIAQILDLYTRWDIDSKTILCKTNGNNIDNITPYEPKIDTLGYLRLEDVSLTTSTYDREYLEKLRIMGNFLSKKGIPYHIAWIPRYINPSAGIDFDPTVRNDFESAQLIYTLDYFTQNNGVIGLHGYTHQNGNEESAVGTEFGPSVPSTDNFRSKIEKAIATAEYLDIPIDFFEAPHYQITSAQNKIAEEYFKILYHPFEDNGLSGVDLTKPQLSPYNNESYYISTPLDYIPVGQTDSALDRIKNTSTSKMGSLFYHPRSDFESITLSDENGIPTFSYDDNSILKRVVNILEEKGYTMSKVSDIQ